MTAPDFPADPAAAQSPSAAAPSSQPPLTSAGRVALAQRTLVESGVPEEARGVFLGGLFGADLWSEDDCPTGVMPRWVANLAAVLSWRLQAPERGRAIAGLVERAAAWRGLDAEAWGRVEAGFAKRAVAMARDAARRAPRPELDLLDRVKESWALAAGTARVVLALLTGRDRLQPAWDAQAARCALLRFASHRAGVGEARAMARVCLIEAERSVARGDETGPAEAARSAAYAGGFAARGACLLKGSAVYWGAEEERADDAAEQAAWGELVAAFFALVDAELGEGAPG